MFSMIKTHFYSLIMKNYYFLFILIFSLTPSVSFSQVGINTETPHASSMLDINSSNKGLLIPKVELTDIADTNTISSPATGLLVYKTGANSELSDGFYYWNGTQWTALGRETNDNWSISGNITNGNNFLGTINETALIFKVNDSIVGNLTPEGGVGFGLGATTTEDGIAIGGGSHSGNTLGISIGKYSQSFGEYGTAIGVEANAANYNSTAFGHLAKANGRESVAIGGGAVAGNGIADTSAVAVGPYAKATAWKSFALGPNTEASAVNSFALGIGAVADIPNTIILGEVRKDTIDETPLLVGIGTTNPRARFDVNGRFVLGQKGSSMKNLAAFTYVFDGTTTIQENKSTVISIDIPSEIQPFTLDATIQTTLLDPVGNYDALYIQWSRFQNEATIRLKIKNEADSEMEISQGTQLNISIIEFD